MANWDDTCSQAGSNKPLENPKQEEWRSGCEPPTPVPQTEPRERRSEMRVTDIHRIVNKRLEEPVKENPYLNKYFVTGLTNLPVQSPSSTTAGSNVYPPVQMIYFDRNTPESLKQLRWTIYELIESFEGDYGKTVSVCLKQEVERLFKEYTNS